MYIYIYIYMYISMYVYVPICIYPDMYIICIYTCLCRDIREYNYKGMDIQISMYYIHIHVYSHVYPCIFMYPYPCRSMSVHVDPCRYMYIPTSLGHSWSIVGRIQELFQANARQWKLTTHYLCQVHWRFQYIWSMNFKRSMWNKYP